MRERPLGLAALLVLAMALSTSCSTKWYHPTKGETTFHEDTLRCQATANQMPPQPDAPPRSGGELPDFVNDFLEFCQKTGSSREECTEYLVDWMVEEAKK